MEEYITGFKGSLHLDPLACCVLRISENVIKQALPSCGKGFMKLWFCFVCMLNDETTEFWANRLKILDAVADVALRVSDGVSAASS